MNNKNPVKTEDLILSACGRDVALSVKAWV